MSNLKAGIVGGSSLLAGLLIEMLDTHPLVDLVYIESEHHSGKPLGQVHQFLKMAYKSKKFEKFSSDFILKHLDVVFVCKPHRDSMKYVKQLYNEKIKIIDLSGDFRLKDIEEYEKWYGAKHIASMLLSKAVYGLSEIYTEKIKRSFLVANPGCYPTGILLSLYPLLKNKAIHFQDIFIVSYSGVSGAGRNPIPGKNLFMDAFNNIIAYKVTDHQHTPEIEAYLSDFAGKEISLNFVPHITSIENGIFNTIIVKPQKTMTENDYYNFYEKSYSKCKFIEIHKDRIPQVKDVVNTNFCRIALKADERTGHLLVFSVIDNRIKGGAGQAVQNMNLMFGFPEETGLI
ncbi:MAG: N-acetyl-gamma-glutamyl-phosphate reductase [Spirochaetes bacterium]|nr:N-acetyl-gamma-glutamyl-phosphate reductase [Spirochaetota bacterium]